MKLSVQPNVGEATNVVNPFESASADWIEEFLRGICAEGLRPKDRATLDEEIKALVPAMVELRDAGHLKLNALALSRFGSREGFVQLADDERLSEAARRRCDAVRTRTAAEGAAFLELLIHGRSAR